MSSTSRLEIESPRPVPPKRRAVEPSACANGSNNCGKHGRSDADPGVLHLETQHDVAAENLERNDARDDAAAFGEFHRVAQQVQQDLTQPVGVASTGGMIGST